VADRENLPAPLTPPECDLQDFEFMPVMVRRLLKSDTWSLGTGDERAAAVALWFESWHQVPAASLPDNDRLLARLADTSKWNKVKEQALRGWVRCNDGRLYHPVVAEKALEAWLEKLLNSISGAVGNAKRWEISIDTTADVQRLRVAAELLRALEPKAKALRKKAVLTILGGSPPDGSGSSPPDNGGSSPPDRKGQGEGQGQGSSSVPDGTGAEAPAPAPNPVETPPPPPPAPPAPPAARRAKTPADEEKSLLWAALKTALVEQATCKDLKEAGVLLGKAARDYGETVFLEAARATVEAKPGNTHTYLIALCEHAAGKRQTLNRQVQLEDTNLAAAAAFAGG
jgi:hypothetical protein